MQPNSQVTLLEAARIVARGGELDAKLDALCQHILSAAGADAAVIYLHDPVAQILVPAAQAGLTDRAVLDRGVLPVSDTASLAARVTRERRAATATGTDAAGALPTPAGAVAALPLIAADETGDEDAEGVLVAAFADSAPDLTGPENTLTALADLCAVAIRQARLQSALLERADWIGRLASTDAITGLANEVTFQRMLELEIARATRQETQLSIVLFDIDGFAQINEKSGTPAGDDVLRHMAATLADQVRLVDTVARVGRDEFALIAPGGGGEVAGRRIRDVLTSHETAGHSISVGVGVAIYPADGATSEELMNAARAALREAKRRGRGSIVVAAHP